MGSRNLARRLSIFRAFFAGFPAIVALLEAKSRNPPVWQVFNDPTTHQADGNHTHWVPPRPLGVHHPKRDPANPAHYGRPPAPTRSLGTSMPSTNEWATLSTRQTRFQHARL